MVATLYAAAYLCPKTLLEVWIFQYLGLCRSQQSCSTVPVRTLEGMQ